MTEEKSPKRFDLEERTYRSAREVRAFVKSLDHTLANVEDARQLIRSSGSIGTNYIEANEALGKKDFVLHVKICRKEAKESRYWLQLIETNASGNQETDRIRLIREAQELMNIFGAIVRKSGC